jgi:hypothetical protein
MPIRLSGIRQIRSFAQRLLRAEIDLRYASIKQLSINFHNENSLAGGLE